ncbi:MAG: TonB family protein, partial [Candidatus Acidiferrum sp.]
VLSLPRAAQPKSAAPTPIHLTPPPRDLAPQPVPVAPAVPQDVASAKTVAESSTDALRAENARLQEQLAALLIADGKKNDTAKSAAPVIAAPASDLKPANAAAKIFELAHPSPSIPVAPKPVAATSAAEKISSPAPAPIAQPPAPQSPVAAKTASPERTSSLPLPSFRDEEHVKIPSWLEPLARNAAVAMPTDEAAATSVPAAPSTSFVFDEPVPDAHWLNKDGLNKGVLHKDGLHAERPQEDGAAQLHNELSQENTSQVDGTQESLDNIPTPDFGSRFLMEEKSAGASKSNKLVFVGIAAAVIFAVASGGYWYTHQGSLAGPATAAQTASAQRPSDSAAAAATPQETLRGSANTPANTRPGAIVNQIPTPAALNTNMVVTPSHASQPTTVAPSNGVAQPLVAQPAAVQPKRPALGEVHLAAPTVTRTENSGSPDADPGIALNGSATPAETIPGASLASSSGPVAPSVPIPVGGDVKSAQLLKSIPPIYPPFARTQRISGDVKIDALIDATGKVTTMKVVSGPTLLHQAAMDALHQWKYQPATLDGKAVPMHLTVTIQFRMQ